MTAKTGNFLPYSPMYNFIHNGFDFRGSKLVSNIYDGARGATGATGSAGATGATGATGAIGALAAGRGATAGGGGGTIGSSTIAIISELDFAHRRGCGRVGRRVSPHARGSRAFFLHDSTSLMRAWELDIARSFPKTHVEHRPDPMCDGPANALRSSRLRPRRPPRVTAPRRCGASEVVARSSLMTRRHWYKLGC